MNADSNPKLIDSFNLFAKRVSIIVVFVGFLVLIGWIFNLDALTSIGPGVSTMKANSAIGFILSGIALWGLVNQNIKDIYRQIAQGCAFIVAILGVLTLGEYLSGLNFGIDQLFFIDSVEDGPFPGRMSPATALNFSLIGVALLFLYSRWQQVWFNDLITITVLFISLLAVVGYIYEVSSLYQIGAYSSIALHTAVNFALIALGILFARPESGLMENVTKNGLGGSLARRLLPAALIIPFIVGLLCLTGHLLGLYNVRFGFAIFTLLNVIIFSALIWWNAGILNQMDTDRRQVDQAYHESEARYRHTLDAMMEGCQIIGNDWRYIYLNDAADQHNRRPKEELLGKKYVDAWPGIESTEVFALMQKCMDEHEPQSMENKFMYPDGGQGWFELRIYPVPEGIVIHSVDITERKLAEEALQESNDNACSLLNLSKKLEQAQTYSEALNAALDEVKVVLGYNNVWTYLLSEDKQQLRLLTISGGKLQTITDDFLILKIKGDRFLEEISDGRDIILVEDARIDPRTNKEIVEQLGNRTIVNVPIIFMDKQLGVFGTGTFGDEGIRVPTPIQMDYLRALASHMAVTLDRIHLLIERKAVEKEIRHLNESLEERIEERTAQLGAANKELEAFSYSVSHDLRSPLRGIDGWSLALLEDYGGMLDEQGQAHIQRVRAETQRMGMLIDDILQLSRITRSEMNKEKVDLSAIAETVVARLQETKSQDRQVEFVIQKGLTAIGDPKLLDVVLTNLIGNSFKFTSKKQNAFIEFGQTVIEGDRAFFVRDNGAGFDMTYANKLFGAFQRMHRVSEFPGTGVGLATVQRVIHRHGGSIWASSEVDQGATFYFILEENNK